MPSISKLIVGNFKSIRERVEIPVAPLTFLFGPNSAGKSAILGAMRALLDRIEEGPIKARGFSPTSGDRPPPAIARGEAYREGQRKVVTESEESSSSEYPNVILGVEIEDFAGNDDLPISGDRNLPNRDAPDVLDGISFFHALDGATIQLEIHEFYVADLFRESLSTLHVDQVALLEFSTGGLVHSFGLSRCLDHPGERPALDLLSSLGAVRLNLTHPLWSLSSISEGAVNIEPQIDRDNAVLHPSRLDKDDLIEFHDKRWVRLKSVLNLIRNVLLKNTSPFLSRLVQIEDGWLTIRASVEFLDVKQWAPDFLDQKSYADLSERAKWDAELEKANLPIIEKINYLLSVLACLGRLVLASTAESLRVLPVDGDRGVLQNKDVMVRLPKDFAYQVCGRFWPASAAEWSIYRGPNPGSYLSMYAFWLGGVSARIFDRDIVDRKIYESEDFVNCVLSKGVFGARKYIVKPIVWSITTNPLLLRESSGGVDEDEESVELKVQLYLEDQNGRKLDFSEVGSGISYVMPILASLQGAKTSWIAQPELHLHPAAQCEMGDVLLRALNRGHYAVVETHSEHMLLRVLRRIRETTRGVKIDEDLKCPPEVVTVLYFDPKEDGGTEIRQLRVTRLGDFKDRWPNGFFEERSRELFDE